MWLIGIDHSIDVLCANLPHPIYGTTARRTEQFVSEASEGEINREVR
jgi:hypothetical protein